MGCHSSDAPGHAGRAATVLSPGQVCAIDPEALLGKLNDLDALLLHRFPQYFELAPDSYTDAEVSVPGVAPHGSSAPTSNTVSDGSSSMHPYIGAVPRRPCAASPTGAGAQLAVRRPHYAPPVITASFNHSRSSSPRSVNQYGARGGAHRTPALAWPHHSSSGGSVSGSYWRGSGTYTGTAASRFDSLHRSTVAMQQAGPTGETHTDSHGALAWGPLWSP